MNKRKENLKKWGINLLKFTAPMCVAFFGALAQGVEIEKAWPIALVIFWGILADLFKKLK